MIYKALLIVVKFRMKKTSIHKIILTTQYLKERKGNGVR